MIVGNKDLEGSSLYARPESLDKVIQPLKILRILYLSRKLNGVHQLSVSVKMRRHMPFSIGRIGLDKRYQTQ